MLGSNPGVRKTTSIHQLISLGSFNSLQLKSFGR